MSLAEAITMATMPADDGMNDDDARKRYFATTSWSVVVAAGAADGADAKTALAELCAAYWYPLYAYVRRRGRSADDAQDVTQAFFTRLLEKQAIQVADRQRGKFRSFLLGSLDHFLANEFDRANAKKRGGGRAPIALDFASGESRVTLEPAHNLTPEREFERQWALALLETVVRRLEAEYAAAGKSRHFELLKDALARDRDRLAFAEIAEQLELSADAARQAAHRLRKRYRALLREEVARTVADPAEVDEELTALFRALED
jgi:RNA polymerase sigma-70 factor (ECF subfamily)